MTRREFVTCVADCTPFLLISILLAVAGGCGGHTHAASEDESKPSSEPIPVRMESAELRTMAQVIEGLVTCEPLLNKTAALAPAIEGRVSAILVKPGQEMKAGQPIVQLDTTVVEANLKEKKVTREGLEASLRLLKALPRPDEQKLLQLAIDDAKVSVKKAESMVEAVQPLLDRKEIPNNRCSRPNLALDLARVQQQKAEMALTVAMLGARPEAIDEAVARHHRRGRGRGLGPGATRFAHHPLAHRWHPGQDHLPDWPIADGGDADRRSRRSRRTLCARVAADP